MKCAYPRILAYLLSVHSEGIFGKVFNGLPHVHKHDFPVNHLKHLFMLAVFVVIVTLDFNQCLLRKLPKLLQFLFEFFVSLLIFDIICAVIWQPIVYTVYVSLPQVIYSILGINECCCYEKLCLVDRLPFCLLLHVLTLIFFGCVMFTYEIFSFDTNVGLSRIKPRWSNYIRRIYHSIMCTEDSCIEECDRCNHSSE